VQGRDEVLFGLPLETDDPCQILGEEIPTVLLTRRPWPQVLPDDHETRNRVHPPAGRDVAGLGVLVNHGCYLDDGIESIVQLDYATEVHSGGSSAWA
jgi:hypothetical protein